MKRFLASSMCLKKWLYWIILPMELLFLTRTSCQWQYAGLGGYVIDVRSVGNNLFAATEYSVFRSSNDGKTWDTLASPGIEFISTVEVIDSIILVGASWGCADCFGDQTTITRSTDGGKSWTPVFSTPAQYLGVNSIKDSRGYLFANGAFGPPLFRSSDRGLTWSHVRSDSVFADLVSSLDSFNDTLYVAEANRIGYSTDNGERWSFLSVGWGNAGTVLFARQDSFFFAGTTDGVYRSTSSDTMWEKTSPVSDVVMGLSIADNNVFAAFMQYPSVKLYSSSIIHEGWQDVGLGLNIPWWAQVTFARHGEFIYIGTDNGVWRRPLSEMVTFVNGSTDRVPVAYQLDQNYPNPFNPSTSISFTIPKQTQVRLQVFNVLGQLMATLVDESKPPGTYTVTWDPSTRPSGLYVYRMTAGNFVQTKKALLLK